MKQCRTIIMRGLKESGSLILLLLVFLSGCAVIEQETTQHKLEYYGCYWGCRDNQSGEIGWCCLTKVPKADHYIFDCKNAKERVIQ